MEWLTSKLTDVQNILKLIFMIIVGAVAIKLLAERKMIAILLFAVAVGLLGWFVIDASGAINTFKGLWK